MTRLNDAAAEAMSCCWIRITTTSAGQHV